MEGETTVAKKGVVGTIVKSVIGLSLGLLGFVASLIWSGYQKIEDRQTVINDRIRILEEDKVKWATLAAMEKQVIELRIQLEVMRQVWSYEYGRKVPTGFPEKPGEPHFKVPEELFRDVERYRTMQQQRIPRQFEK